LYGSDCYILKVYPEGLPIWQIFPQIAPFCYSSALPFCAEKIFFSKRYDWTQRFVLYSAWHNIVAVMLIPIVCGFWLLFFAIMMTIAAYIFTGANACTRVKVKYTVKKYSDGSEESDYCCKMICGCICLCIGHICYCLNGLTIDILNCLLRLLGLGPCCKEGPEGITETV